MNKHEDSQPVAARLSVEDITRLLAEIGDLVFTRNQIEADQEASHRAMDEACVPIKAPFVEAQERMAETIEALANSIDARAEVVEAWCRAHKDEQFPLGQRTRREGGMIYGFRWSNPRVDTLILPGRWQRFVRDVLWRLFGWRWSRPAQLDKRLVLADAGFLERHPRLSRCLGLAIVQQDDFVLKPASPRRGSRPEAEQEAA